MLDVRYVRLFKMMEMIPRLALFSFVCLIGRGVRSLDMQHQEGVALLALKNTIQRSCKRTLLLFFLRNCLHLSSSSWTFCILVPTTGVVSCNCADASVRHLI